MNFKLHQIDRKNKIKNSSVYSLMYIHKEGEHRKNQPEIFSKLPRYSQSTTKNKNPIKTCDLNSTAEFQAKPSPKIGFSSSPPFFSFLASSPISNPSNPSTTQAFPLLSSIPPITISSRPNSGNFNPFFVAQIAGASRSGKIPVTTSEGSLEVGDHGSSSSEV